MVNLKPGDRIAVEIQWSGNAEKEETLTLYYNSHNYDSHLELEPETPNPPVPELPTLALVGIGFAYLLLRTS